MLDRQGTILDVNDCVRVWNLYGALCLQTDTYIEEENDKSRNNVSSTIFFLLLVFIITSRQSVRCMG